MSLLPLFLLRALSLELVRVGCSADPKPGELLCDILAITLLEEEACSGRLRCEAGEDVCCGLLGELVASVWARETPGCQDGDCMVETE